ncbi:hypothetical protein HDE78_001483 [Rhodanobacter sp. K2T2]|uniref:hypothetical protein n=1 Tax=Rhodanobacter sp. K2T2 TaxID=2723085 RepID=UPI0015C6BE81|nr:hypothetical protein [Rhodanobacter sp. K2T2]NYE28531.1 hypothetical protein [Rhodanobacter sp. K2T2]
MARTQTRDQIQSLDQLRQWLPKGTRVFTILRNVSRTGMCREISVVVWLPGEGRPIHPNHHVCQALGLRRGKQDGVVLQGCGMDMGFHLVYELSHALYGDADALTHEWL